MQGSTQSGGLLDFLTGIGKTTSDIITAVKGGNKTTSSATGTAKTTTPAWLMPALLIGGALLAVFVVFKLVK